MLSRLLFLLLIFIVPIQLYAQDEKYDLTLRWGQGGFSDSRSIEGKLGGGQFAIDIKLKEFPIAINFSGEYYKNSQFATHSYEIEHMDTINIFYVSKLFELKSTDFFIGGGFGRMKVPKDVDYPEGTDYTVEFYYADAYNLELGINFRYFEHVGFYSVVKYLKANKTVNNEEVVDFNEKILLIGITYNFSL